MHLLHWCAVLGKRQRRVCMNYITSYIHRVGQMSVYPPHSTLYIGLVRTVYTHTHRI